MMNNLATDPVLCAVLRPLSRYYAATDVVEVRMSEPKALTVERHGLEKTHIVDAALTLGEIEYICTILSNYNRLRFDADTAPQLSCTLPEGHRFECMVGASVQSGVSLAIRCKHPYQATPQSFGLSDALAEVIFSAVQQGKNIIISGGTNTGKTTFLNMLVQSLPEDTRVVCAEDTPEIDYRKFSHDSVGLIATRGQETAGMSSWSVLSDHMNRITPSRLIYGEISTRNVQGAIAAMNSGVEGVMCTIHASSPELALDYKFDQNLQLGRMSMNNVSGVLREVVDLVIQIKRQSAEGDHGKRIVTAVYDVKNNAYLYGGGQ